MAREPSWAELNAEARHAAARVALYQQRLYSGKGDLRRLEELKRIAAGAAERLQHATPAGPAGDEPTTST